MNPTDLKILHAIAELPNPDGITIAAHVNHARTENWLTRRWPILNEFRGLSVGGLYVALDRLERAGFVSSEWGTERPPERGYHRRRHYFLTDAGRSATGEAP